MSKQQSRRQLKVAQSVKEELSTLIIRQSRDAALNLVTITDVEMTVDLKRATVFYSVLDTSTVQRTGEALAKAAPFFQRHLATMLKLRFTPILEFAYDDTAVRSAKIASLIAETHREREQETRDAPVETRLVTKLNDAQRVLICGHRKLDGDAAGSLLAMTAILERMGKTVTAFAPEGVPEYLRFLPGWEAVVSTLPESYTSDITLILDVSSRSLLPTGLPTDSHGGTVLVIDHHHTSESFGDIVIRRKASATGEIVTELLLEHLWPRDEHIATCLYTAISADTGSFMYDNATERTFRAAAELVRMGAAVDRVAHHLYESFPLARQRLMGLVTHTLNIRANGRLATMYCTREMLETCHADGYHLEGLVNIGRSVIGVEVAILVKETDTGAKVSFRSNGHIDVAQLAARWDGGGHQKAAGASFTGGEVSRVLETVARSIEQHMDHPM